MEYYWGVPNTSIEFCEEKYIINPKRNKGVLCDGYKHYYYYPKHGYRIVLIYTFI